MKQHITEEQLWELTREQREQLIAWWKPTLGDRVVEWIRIKPRYYRLKEMMTAEGLDTDGMKPAKRDEEEEDFRSGYGTFILISKEELLSLLDPLNKYLPLLSIGQMIELLIEKYGCFYAGYDHTTLGNKQWELVWPGVFLQKDNLADALWEAVKEVL